MRIWKRVLLIALAVLFLALLVLGVLAALRQQEQAPPLDALLANYDEIVSAIRTGMGNHSARITIHFAYTQNLLPQITDAVSGWVEDALAETDSPTEGDYLRYQYAGYKISNSYTQENGVYDYTIEVRPEYYAHSYWETETDEFVAALMPTFGFDGSTTDLEKIQAIYDYVCENVEYNQFHRRSPYYHLRSTCYSALIRRRASCQGYAVTLYRLLRTAGVNCRVISGTGYRDGREEQHAWNIVQLDGAWYALDATWDAGQEAYTYFLRGTEDLTDHVPDAEFLTEDFQSQYPVALNDYAM